MPNVVIVGTQWGDEGKGKIVDLLAKDADLIVRYQGGANAGHTVIHEQRQYTFHLMPSGILHPGKVCILGNGVVIDPANLIEEIEFLESNKVEVGKNLSISHRAHLIMPYHRVIERANEEIKGTRRIGTTGRGIGPAYVDKMARIGIQVGDLLSPHIFRRKIEDNIVEMNYLLDRLYGTESLDVETIYRQYLGYAGRLKDYITDVSLLINGAIDSGKRVLFEGAQGTHLDVDHGTYPFVTSSSATAGGACTGTGIGPTRIDCVMGVMKAYATRVGSGPFPTELTGALGERLKEHGNEYGATTGRPRRCGWYDAVAVRYAVRVNGLQSLAVTKIDVLDGEPEMKVCTHYRYQGRLFREMPVNAEVIQNCEPVYEVFKGWETPTKGITSLTQLPREAKRFLQGLEDEAGCPIDLISTGSRGDETIILHNPMTGHTRRLPTPWT